MTHDEILSRTRAVLAKVLELDPSQISNDMSSVTLSNWDSLRHMNVILSLENEFDIEFDDAEIQKLQSLSSLADAISRHLQG